MKQAKELPLNQALRTVRKRLKLTLEEFGRKAQISASMLHSYESGRRNVSDESKEKIVKALIQALADASRKEREEKLLAFGPVSESLATSAPDVSAALKQYCVGREVTGESAHARR
jgi:transcriptional regulator with XRE-family HTH domain